METTVSIQNYIPTRTWEVATFWNEPYLPGVRRVPQAQHFLEKEL